MVMIAAAAQGMSENTSHISHVTDLVQASQIIPIERLAMVLGILAVAAVIVSMFELGRIGYWIYDSYKRRRQSIEAPGTSPVRSSQNDATQAKIEQRVQDIHDNTTECGATQRDTLNYVREFRQDAYKSFERISKHIEANTQAVQANTQVLQSLVDRIEFASKAGMDTVVK